MNMPEMQKEKELEKKLKEIQEKSVEEEAMERAKKAGLPYLDLTALPIQKETFDVAEEAEAKAAGLTPISKLGKNLKVAVLNPEDEKTKNLIKKLKQKGFEVKIYVVSPKSIAYAFGLYKDRIKTKEIKLGVMELAEEKISQFEKEIKNLSDLESRISKITTTEMLEILFVGALSVRTSDIHFEPEDKQVRLRFRIDGVLHDIFDLKKGDYPATLNRIKLMAGLKINIHDAPQDGRFTLKREKTDIEVRVSALPGTYGESIVMRLLDPKTIKKNLDELGLRKDLLEEIKKQLKKTTGAILTTGPTGSGKTTTLYAFVNSVNKPGIKIITIEDPVEYHIEGISQTQVEPEKGYNFANGLKSIVRQDPDVILVGEIRDSETAEIAMHAALTGHLVFTTLHTNDAAGTIPRLIDMGAKPQIIAPAINIAMAQRLVRKLCQKCKKKAEANPEEAKKIKEALRNLSQKVKTSGMAGEIEIFWPGKCEECNSTGYNGRIGIFEVFIIDGELEKLILQSPAISEIKDLVIKKGMVTMQQDGYLKVLEGITDLGELERVLGE